MLPPVAEKGQTSLSSLFSNTRIERYYDCGQFPAREIEPERPLSYADFRKLPGCVYMNDHSIRSSKNERLRSRFEDLVRPFGPWASGGSWDLLRWLGKDYQIPEDTVRDYMERDAARNDPCGLGGL